MQNWGQIKTLVMVNGNTNILLYGQVDEEDFQTSSVVKV